MANLENHPEETDYEDGDHDQFDLGNTFDDLEPSYFENQTHLPADIQARNEEVFKEEYEEEFGSAEDSFEDSKVDLKTDTSREWTEAIENLKSLKESLDRITNARKIAFDEYNEAKSKLFQLLDSNNTDLYTTKDYIIKKVTRKGRVSYKNAMVDICGGETDLFSHYADKHRGATYFALSIREIPIP